MSDQNCKKKLSLSKRTVKNLGVRSGAKTGTLNQTTLCQPDLSSKIYQTMRCPAPIPPLTGFCSTI